MYKGSDMALLRFTARSLVALALALQTGCLVTKCEILMRASGDSFSRELTVWGEDSEKPGIQKAGDETLKRVGAEYASSATSDDKKNRFQRRVHRQDPQ